MAKGESTASARLGWAIAALYAAHSVLLSFMPRVDKFSALREDLRGVHYSIGIVLMVLVAIRLWRWAREPRLLTDGGLGSGQQLLHRALALTWWISLLVAGVLGFFYGWAEGRDLRLFGLISLPPLLPKDHAVWQFSGYFHSASALMGSLFALIILISGMVSLFRRRIGVLAAFPSGIGAMAISGFLVTVYVFNSFKVVTQGLVAAAVVSAIMAGIAWWGLRRATPAQEVSAGSPGLLAQAGTAGIILVTLGLASYAPHATYGVVPWATGVVVRANPDLTWHQDRRVTEVVVAPPTPFQAKVEQDAYKWCKFCHTMKAGESHLVGPNLHNIIGQRAGTAPNYHYSEALAEAGRKGLVWDEATIKRFIAAPEKLVPGNRMIVNRGPVTDPAQQEAVINLLKRDAMSDNK